MDIPLCTPHPHQPPTPDARSETRELPGYLDQPTPAEHTTGTLELRHAPMDTWWQQNAPWVPTRASLPAPSSTQSAQWGTRRWSTDRRAPTHRDSKCAPSGSRYYLQVDSGLAHRSAQSYTTLLLADAHPSEQHPAIGGMDPLGTQRDLRRCARGGR